MSTSFDDKISLLRKTFEKQETLIRVFKELSSEMELCDLLRMIIEKSTEIMEADRSTCFLLDEQNEELFSKVAQGAKEIRIPLSAGIAGSVCRTGTIVNIKDAYSDERFNRDVDKKTGYKTKTILCVPMRNAEQKVIGVIQVLNKEVGTFTEEDEELLLALASGAAIFVENAQLYQEIANLFEAILNVASKTIDDRDPCTAGHSKRVTLYAQKLARAVDEAKGSFVEVNFSKAELKQLHYAAVLHDFGKIGVREHVLTKGSKVTNDRLEVLRLRLELEKRDAKDDNKEELCQRLDDDYEFLKGLNKKGFLAEEELERLKALQERRTIDKEDFVNLSVKKGNLTENELRDMRSHAEKSLAILNQIPWPTRLSRVPEIAGSHHEKLNGQGYPKGLPAEDIPIESRILAIADIYDALTAQDRPYKPAIPHEKAKNILGFMVKDGELSAELVELFFAENCFEID